MSNDRPNRTRRFAGLLRFVPGVVVATATMAALWTPTSQAQETQVTAAFVRASDYLPLYVAKEKGFFKERKLDVNLLAIPAMPDIAGAVFSGAAQFGATTAPGFIEAVQGGLDLVAVSGASRMVKDEPVAAVLSKSDSGISKATDFIGKRVAMAGFRGFLDVLFRNWLLQNTVDPNNVKMVEAIHPQMADLLNGGSVDAIVTVEPFIAFATKDGRARVVANFVGEVNPDIVATFWMARRDWAEQNPGAVRAFREGWQEGIAFIQKNPDAAHEIEKNISTSTRPRCPLSPPTSPLETWRSTRT